MLRLFGAKEGRAIKKYREFMEAGIGQGRRPELIGGGLVRSQGGWSQVLSTRRRKALEKSDERVLGSEYFVERIIAEAEKLKDRQLIGEASRRKVQETMR